MFSYFYKIQKYLKIPIPVILKKYLKKYYGKNNLDKKLENYLKYNNGFYIDKICKDINLSPRVIISTKTF